MRPGQRPYGRSSEIYGGTGSVWVYSPLGVELDMHVRNAWWYAMVRSREDVEGFDAAIFMHPTVWEANSHVSGFDDPLVDCRACFRADQLDGSSCLRKPSKKPGEHTGCQLTEPRQFNLMFKTFIGPVVDPAAVVYCLGRWCICLETGNREKEPHARGLESGASRADRAGVPAARCRLCINRPESDRRSLSPHGRTRTPGTSGTLHGQSMPKQRLSRTSA